jgi:type I restriction enzyme, S subunit
MSTELRPGYKRTEVGIIPKDWTVFCFADLFNFRNGINADKYAYGRGTRFINVLEIITRSHLHAADIPGRVSLPKSTLDAFSVREGDIVFNRTSETQNEVGLSAVYQGKEAVVFGGFVIRGRPKLNSLDPEYCGYALRAPVIRSQIISRGQGVIRANVGQADLRKVMSPFPVIAEQRAIATVLSDVDALINGLDQLIAKKRDIKQAAMQQLLTGQTRLPGFSGAWEKKRLGDIGEMASAGVDKKIRHGEIAVRLVNYLDVYRKDFLYSVDLSHTVTAPFRQAKRCEVKRGDIFFTPSSETRDDIGHSAVAMENIPDAAHSYHIARLRLHDDWDLRFRAYAFKTKDFFDQAQILCDGNGTRYVISLGKFRRMTVYVPPIEEQVAIATVLSDMDADLAALEARRDKTRALKDGMMQELLTGRIRLVSANDIGD